MNNKKIGSYLLYAAGEIILVVIGILIALQVNNWNEKRKEDELQVKILQNLAEDIRYNLVGIQNVYAEDSINVIRNRRLLSLLQDPSSSYHDSLQNYFGEISRYDVFAPRKMAYEALKSKGLELIENEDLRSEIIKLYDEKYPFNTLILEFKKEIHMEFTLLFNKNFLTLETANRKVPGDFIKLKKNQEFINMVSYITAEYENFNSMHRDQITETKSVSDQIDAELRKLTK